MSDCLLFVQPSRLGSDLQTRKRQGLECKNEPNSPVAIADKEGLSTPMAPRFGPSRSTPSFMFRFAQPSQPPGDASKPADD
jgi:hypothetical protein